MTQQHSSKTIHIVLWVAQILLALILISGTYLKFMPIEKISTTMPWTGQIPELHVRLLGFIDLVAAVGLVLPSLLRIKPQLTVKAAMGTVALMISAILFHISRGESAVIGINIFAIVLALFVAWGRLKKAPIVSK